MRLFIVILLFIIEVTFAQNQNNLYIFNSIFGEYLNSELNSVDIINKSINFNFVNKKAELLKTSVYSTFSGKGCKIVSSKDTADLEFNLVIDTLETKYLDIVSFPLFSDKIVSRENIVIGQFTLSDSKTDDLILAKKINIHIIDTLQNFNKKNIEFDSDEILTNDIPKTPFWRSMIEPIIFSAATIATFYAFFSIRSK